MTERDAVTNNPLTLEEWIAPFLLPFLPLSTTNMSTAEPQSTPTQTPTPAPTEHKETLRPPSSDVERRYVVEIKEITRGEQHVQQYRTKGKRADGSENYGYVTTVERYETPRVIFAGEFAKRPSIAALATLLESSG